MGTPQATPDRLVAIVADARVIGLVQARKRWRISHQTMHNYVDRVAADEAISRRVVEAVARILEAAQENAGRALAATCYAIETRVATLETRDDFLALEALTKALRSLGELHICYETINAELNQRSPITIESSPAPASGAGEITVLSTSPKD